jgi:hypothetical protein
MLWFVSHENLPVKQLNQLNNSRFNAQAATSQTKTHGRAFAYCRARMLAYATMPYFS